MPCLLSRAGDNPEEGSIQAKWGGDPELDNEDEADE